MTRLSSISHENRTIIISSCSMWFTSFQEWIRYIFIDLARKVQPLQYDHLSWPISELWIASIIYVNNFRIPFCLVSLKVLTIRTGWIQSNVSILLCLLIMNIINRSLQYLRFEESDFDIFLFMTGWICSMHKCLGELVPWVSFSHSVSLWSAFSSGRREVLLIF
jgi:hypothetical protein